MSKTRIFVFGDSHTRALLNAANESSTEDDFVFSIHWMRSEKNGVVRGDLGIEDAFEKIKSLGGQDILVISLLGTAHNIFGLVQHEQPFDLMEAGSSFDMEDLHGQIVPRNIMWDMFEFWGRRNKKIKKLKDCSSVRVFHLMTPPPKQDNGFIESKTAKYRDHVVAVKGISRAELRLRLWNLEMQVLKHICDEWGIGVIPPPNDAIETEGFLKKEFYGNDATHANTAYGALVLKQLKDIAASGG